MFSARMATGIAAFTLFTAQAQSQLTFSVIHNFGGSGDGEYPTTPLVSGSNGVLYGTTNLGGPNVCTGLAGCGIVFSLTPPASSNEPWKESVIYNFTGGSSDGALPSGLSMGSDGVLYGTTQYGGGGACDLGCGTVFSLTPPASPGGAWTEKLLHSFGGGPGDGAIPHAGIIVGPGGVLYGTTQYGGSGPCMVPFTGCGTVFSLTPPQGGPGAPGAWTETVLHEFVSSPTDGASPVSGLALADGVFYGTTSMGGSGVGTVYSLTPPSAGSAWTEKVLYAFSGLDGSYPQAGVLVYEGSDSATVLYGTTNEGGTNFSSGTVYSLVSKPDGTWSEQVLLSFPVDDSSPNGGVVMDSAGLLYGTTSMGGIDGLGTVYQLKPPAEGAGDGWTEVVLHQFAAGGGARPMVTLTWGSGILYGTAYYGGKNNRGTVFSLRP